MAWTHFPGLAGKVFVPDRTGEANKKHSCDACFTCQWCDETRCQVCRGDGIKIGPSTPLHPESAHVCRCVTGKRA